MMLKVGELAKRCGLTVRTLHHYDTIGLLKPSARSDRGYRLYGRDDIARLHQIQALRRLGLSLSDIGAVLANPGSHLVSIIGQQLEYLKRQMDQSRKLHNRLFQLHALLKRGEEPELADWLTTLEMMTMYDKYFTAEELERLPLINNIGDDSTRPEWAELVGSVRQAMSAGISTESIEAQTLAKRWMKMLVRDTQGDPRLLVKLNTMHDAEPEMQEQTGISEEVQTFIQQAFAASKLTIYERYLSSDEVAFMRENYTKHSSEWPPLIGEIRQHLEDGTPVDDPRMHKLTKRWLELFRSYAGDDPQTQANIRAAHEAEPELLEGTFVDRPLLEYVRKAMLKLSLAD